MSDDPYMPQEPRNEGYQFGSSSGGRSMPKNSMDLAGGQNNAMMDEPSPENSNPGPSNNGNDDAADEYDLEGIVDDDSYDKYAPSYPMREYRCGPIKFNPLTSAIGVLVLWGISIWCIVDPEGSLDLLIKWRGKTAEFFTFFYIGTRPLFLCLAFYLSLYYGDVKLGDKDSVPEYSNLTYFAMLLSAGVAVGLFYFGVSEPLWHQQSHWFANSDYRTQDEVDMFALNLTLLHWGFAAWASYVVVALAIGLSAFRFNLPMTFRSCFYPILGEYAWGWIGDLIDGFTIVTTVSGVCTSLGLGAFQVVEGFRRLGLVKSDGDGNQTIEIAVVWGITLIATASVVSGLNVGIKYLSILAFILGSMLIFLVLILDKTSYLLNLQVQSVGYYLQYSVLQLNFWTDAFGQLRKGEGRAVDNQAAEEWWMDAWTVFYMAWWTAWSGFVGLFVGCISKGRTIREVTIYTLVVPLFFSFVWFGTLGGVGLRQARQAMELKKLGLEFFKNETYFLQEGSEFCFDVPQEDVVLTDGTVVFRNHLPGVTPVCLFNSADSDSAFFNVMYSFSFPDDFTSGFGSFISGLSIIAVIIYFVTSSDSGSLVVDFLAANGNLEHHWIQRVFWAGTEGAVATALLRAGGNQALRAVQAASIIAGLPFTLFLCYLLQSLLVMCEQGSESDDMYLHPGNKNEFQMPVYGGIFNVFEFIFSFGRVHEERVERGMDLPSSFQVTEFFYGLIAPFIPLAQVLWVMNPKPSSKVSNNLTIAAYAIFHVMWIVLFIMTTASAGLRAFGWSCFFVNGVILANVKNTFRCRYNMRGNFIGDFFSSLFLFPQVLTQLRIECEELDLTGEEEGELYEESMPQ